MSTPVTPTIDIVGNASSQIPGGQQILLNRPGGFPSPNSGDGRVGTSPNAATSDHSHYGMYDITSPEFGADKTGRTDSTQAIQKAIDLALTNGRGVFAPAGKYLVKYGLWAVMKIDNLSIFYPGFKFIGEGKGVTIFYSNVANNAFLTVDNTAANGTYHINQGGRLQGFSVIGYGKTLATASVGIYLRRQYFFTLEDVEVSTLTSDGIQFDCKDTVSGDLDCCQWITMKNVDVRRCQGWGINFKYPSSGSYNQTAYWKVENTWITLCGTNMGTNPDGSGAGSCFFDETGAAMVPPTSGGVRFKGQNISGENFVLSENWNCGFYGYQGNGQSFLAEISNMDCENNMYGIWLEGFGLFGVKDYRCHHSSTYVPRGALVIDGRTGASDLVCIDRVDLLADNGLGPNYIAFQFCAGTADAIGWQVEHIRWQTAPGANQKTYSDNLFNSSNKTRVTEARRDGTWPDHNSYFTYDNYYNIWMLSNPSKDVASNAAVTFDFHTDCYRFGTLLVTATDTVTAGAQAFNVLRPPFLVQGLRCRLMIMNQRGAGKTMTAAWDAIWHDITGYADPTNAHAVISDWEYNKDLDEMIRCSPFTTVTV